MSWDVPEASAWAALLGQQEVGAAVFLVYSCQPVGQVLPGHSGKGLWGLVAVGFLPAPLLAATLPSKLALSGQSA